MNFMQKGCSRCGTKQTASLLEHLACARNHDPLCVRCHFFISDFFALPSLVHKKICFLCLENSTPRITKGLWFLDSIGILQHAGSFAQEKYFMKSRRSFLGGCVMMALIFFSAVISIRPKMDMTGLFLFC